MDMITQNPYERIFEDMKKHIKDNLKANVTPGGYVEMHQDLDRRLEALATDSLRATFETLDEQFKHSQARQKHYHTKGKRPRTLMTIQGEVRFEREYYVPKEGGEGFFYVDRYLGLPERDYYDPLVKADILCTSGKMSYGQVGRVVADKIGRRCKQREEVERATISRQTTRNIILQANPAPPPDKEPLPVDTLHIQLDEKHVHTQGKEKSTHEVKAAVVHTGVENITGERNRLKDRHVLAETGSAYRLREKLLDHITTHYDLERLSHIIVSGDGAAWIKNSTVDLRFHKDMQVTYVLDRFHTDQAVNHITPLTTIREHLRTCIRKDQKRYFQDTVRALADHDPKRAETILAKAAYLERHWPDIQNQKDSRFTGCSIEGHISSIFAYPFTDRPKGYSSQMMKKILSLRLLEANGEDIRELYLRRYIENMPPTDDIPSINEMTKDRPSPPSEHWLRELFKHINHGGNPILNTV